MKISIILSFRRCISKSANCGSVKDTEPPAADVCPVSWDDLALFIRSIISENYRNTTDPLELLLLRNELSVLSRVSTSVEFCKLCWFRRPGPTMISSTSGLISPDVSVGPESE